MVIAERATRPIPWLSALCYAVAAFGGIPLYFWLRSQSDPSVDWGNSSPLDPYLGTGLLYYGAAGGCAWLLVKLDARAVWPAWFIVLWVALRQVALVRQLIAGTGTGRSALAGLAVLALFAALALHLRKLKRAGVLH